MGKVQAGGEMSTKTEIMRALDSLPDDATIEDIEYHLYVALLLHRRLADTDRSKNLTIDEVRQRLKIWAE
jgi:hypothetical protein